MSNEECQEPAGVEVEQKFRTNGQAVAERVKTLEERQLTFDEIFAVPRLHVPSLQKKFDLASASLKRLGKLLNFAKRMEEEETVVTTTDPKPE